MNLKEYISSGIIESYVLGMATETEREEFEAMCKLHPEIVEARNNFEVMLENQLLQDAITPPIQLKEKIFGAVINVDTANATEIEDEFKTPVRRISVWKVTAAASVLLLAGAIFWAVALNNKYQQAQRANTELRQRLNESTAQLNTLKADAELLQRPGMKVAAMQGTANAPQSVATVYWDTTSKDVYLMINNLPQPTSNRQYQLWALIDNAPVDLGVFEMRQERLLVKMKNVQNAHAFAVTLEPKGGSPTPTGAMYVVGRL